MSATLADDGVNIPRDRVERRVPPLGALNPTLARIELLRVLRNRRTMIFTAVMPALFYLLFGVGQSYSNEDAGNGNVAAYVMISMAAYGAMIAATGGGAMVATERAQGWSRQLRLTPLSPVVYVGLKLVTAMLLGAVAVTIVYVIGAVTNAHLNGSALWFGTALVAWAGSMVFAAFGLFMGYLLPSENVMQLIGPALAVLAFGGGLFVPLQEGTMLNTIAQWTPMYGISQLAHAPLTGQDLHWTWVLNVVVWLALFSAGAVWRFRKDTARV